MTIELNQIIITLIKVVMITLLIHQVFPTTSSKHDPSDGVLEVMLLHYGLYFRTNRTRLLNLGHSTSEQSGGNVICLHLVLH